MTAIRRAATCATGVALLLASVFAAAAPAAPLPPSGTLTLPEEADVTYTGENDTTAGSVVAPAGDVNGDGIRDLLVGDPGANPAQRDRAGTVYVVFGPLPGTSVDLADMGGDRGIRIDGAKAGDRLGTAAAAAGDVDGDGFGDILLGAPRNDDEPGTAYLVFGRRNARQVDLGSPGARAIRFTLGGVHDHTGITVGTAPDMDGDGRLELLIGADRAGFEKEGNTLPPGAAFVVYAKGAHDDVDLSNLGDRGIRIDGEPGSGAGLGLAGAPDVNGDGLGDVVIGAASVGNSLRRRSGSAFVVFGKADAEPVRLDALGDRGFRVDGPRGGSHLGHSVAGLGDVDGDGLGDVA
nr:integrin alpha [Actinomycetota bacterium]